MSCNPNEDAPLSGSIEPYMRRLSEWMQTAYLGANLPESGNNNDDQAIEATTAAAGAGETTGAFTPTHRRHSSAPIPIPGADRPGYTPPRRRPGPPLSDLHRCSLYILVIVHGADKTETQWLPYLHDCEHKGGTLYKLARMEDPHDGWVTGHRRCKDALETVGLVRAVRLCMVKNEDNVRVRDLIEEDDDGLNEVEGLDEKVWVKRVCERLKGAGYLKNESWEVLEEELREVVQDHGEESALEIVDSKVCLRR